MLRILYNCNKMNKREIWKKIILASAFSTSTTIIFAASHIGSVDSVGVENDNGKKVIVHKVEAKETYYSLARLYRVAPKDLIAYNQNEGLKIGSLIKVPTQEPFQERGRSTPRSTGSDRSPSQEAPSTYTVERGETLFSISRKFNVSVDELVSANSLSSRNLSVGQSLIIPQSVPATSNSGGSRVISNAELNTVAESPAVADQEVEETIEEAEPVSEKEAVPNRYGLRQVSNKGVGVWMDDLNGDGGKMLALHNDAPIGTVIKITNPMTNRTTYAKVVGKFNETAQNRDAIIVISKSVASLIGVIDRRFQVSISY